jgi:hypothetical protein
MSQTCWPVSDDHRERHRQPLPSCERHEATIFEDLNETIYGERQYGVEDLGGHRWLFSQHVRDADPAEWGAIIAGR